MTTFFDKNLLPKFESIRDSDEELLWVGKPTLIPFILSAVGGVFVPLIIVGLFVFVFTQPDVEVTGLPMPGLIAIIFIISGLFPLIIRLFVYSNTAYAYSNKRIMIRTGFIGTDFKTIDYDKISDIEVNVNVIERIFNVGTILFFSGRSLSSKKNSDILTNRWIAIKEPYEIYKQVKEISVDIKTDISYPNALRPETNPGYQTQYKKEESSSGDKS